MPEDSICLVLEGTCTRELTFCWPELRHMTPTDCKKSGKCSLTVCPENREEMQMLMGTSNFCHTPWISRRLPKGVELSEKALGKKRKEKKNKRPWEGLWKMYKMWLCQGMGRREGIPGGATPELKIRGGSHWHYAKTERRLDWLEWKVCGRKSCMDGVKWWLIPWLWWYFLSTWQKFGQVFCLQPKLQKRKRPIGVTGLILSACFSFGCPSLNPTAYLEIPPLLRFPQNLF